MTIKIPALSDLSGYHKVIVLKETEGGSFRKTSKHPLGPLGKYIEGLGECVGRLIPYEYDHDRDEHEWVTPTVQCRSTGRKYSYYQYLRNALRRKKMIIVSVPTLHGAIRRLDMHELVLIYDTSPGVQSRIMTKYTESIELKDEESYAHMRACIAG